MASVSDRSLFLEMIKTKPMSINEIISHFGVARNTARSWISHDEVELVVGSYPRQYVRKGSFEIDEPVKKKQLTSGKNTLVIELHRPPRDFIDKLFHMVNDDEPQARFNFTEEFRRVDSLDGIEIIKKHLNTAYLVVEHYEKILKDEELD
jgi:hypothetical protein